ncbi:metal ABC transporter ATP-binding protein [Parafrankia sp. EUN1f]|uniref:metal ABC transporter ATP-binding protein n=1 Tax=Parafrankia sp. EUN1f TaxID=102897 RepID=UPI0001C44E76|nr:ABC transporter related protein [Parafrankia sp. EUN1f]
MSGPTSAPVVAVPEQASTDVRPSAGDQTPVGDRTPVGDQASAGTALAFDDAAIAYGRSTVLHSVHGTLHQGRTLALIGPNGAGKSTLIKAVLGLLPVSSGSITVLGRAPAAARREVAYVPQADTLDRDFPISVGQVVLMGRYRGIGWIRRPSRADRAAAQAALEAVGLADRSRDRFGLLSGGQRQRVLLARAIAAEPRLLLLDEPFNGVDVVSQEALLTALATLAGTGTATVVSTHDLALAQTVSDQVCLLNGRQIAFGPATRALAPDQLREAYGGAALEIGGASVIVTRT